MFCNNVIFTNNLVFKRKRPSMYNNSKRQHLWTNMHTCSHVLWADVTTANRLLKNMSHGGSFKDCCVVSIILIVAEVQFLSLSDQLRWGFLSDILPPRTEVESRYILTPGEIRPALVLKRLFRDFCNASVVADDAGKWRLPQGVPLLLGEHSLFLPPKSKVDRNVKLCSHRQPSLKINRNVFMPFPHRSPWRILWNCVEMRQANSGPTLPPRTNGSATPPIHTSMLSGLR